MTQDSPSNAERSKMSMQAIAREQPRPHQSYKREFLDRVLACSPRSLLDVGCGEAELLQAAAVAGCPECVGVEIDENLTAKHRNLGLDVRAGRAEALPFADGSFDIVTFDYVAHHVEHLQRALFEAARIARVAVFVLDPWYDLAIESQQVARDFDHWSKTIDRRRGLVHNPPVSINQLAAPFLILGGFRIDYSYRLLLQDVPISRIEATAREQLVAIGGSEELEADLARLLDRARLRGFTDDGALSFCAARTLNK
jgi:SAM-dependent methyltransferase